MFVLRAAFYEAVTEARGSDENVNKRISSDEVWVPGTSLRRYLRLLTLVEPPQRPRRPCQVYVLSNQQGCAMRRQASRFR
jgi:hypothetical protein